MGDSGCKRLAILYSRLSGYITACQRTLKELYGVELLVVHWPISDEAPFTEDTFDFVDHRYNRNELHADGIIQLMDDFKPDALLLSGWMDKAYLKTARAMRKRGIPVIAGSDTQWTGSWRQGLAQLLAPVYLHTAIDILWVTGDRQRQLASRLGYRGEACWSGFYACAWEKFAWAEEKQRANVFLYVGRYVDRKGLDVLLDAYRNYRQGTRDPWLLWTVGTGPLEDALVGQEGVLNLGFVQPSDLPPIFQSVTAFILPSRYEPWGVSLHEAAASRLPLISSDACGAADHLIREGINGSIFESGDTVHLTALMRQLSSLTDEEWTRMSQTSFELSKQYTPVIWANTLMNGLKKFKSTINNSNQQLKLP